ncbi:MAG: hypothetical protein ACOC44_01125 [Promethearchaeia archaeon]
MHFLKKLIDNPKFENPAKEHMDIHRHFYRYSRGEFIGPAFYIWRTSTRIRLKGSYEYEDLLQEMVAKTLPEGEEIEIEGTVYAAKDLSDLFHDLGFKWDMHESSGKAKHYKAKFEDKAEKKQILKAINSLRGKSYFLLSFKEDKLCKVDTNKRLPQPSKKKPADDDINKRLRFCKGVIDNTDKNARMALEMALPDFKDEISEDWSKIILTNTYEINKIKIPKDAENSRMMRIMAIREGVLTRSADVDGDVIQKQYNIVV